MRVAFHSSWQAIEIYHHAFCLPACVKRARLQLSIFKVDPTACSGRTVTCLRYHALSTRVFTFCCVSLPRELTGGYPGRLTPTATDRANDPLATFYGAIWEANDPRPAVPAGGLKAC